MRVSEEVPCGPGVSGALPLERIKADVDESLDLFMRAQTAKATDACLLPVIEVIDGFLAGGKRVRPLFCVCGWVAAGGDADAQPVREVGAALELFHTFALIHDDVMDESASPRGRPTVHRTFAERAGRGAAEPPAAPRNRPRRSGSAPPRRSSSGTCAWCGRTNCCMPLGSRRNSCMPRGP